MKLLLKVEAAGIEPGQFHDLDAVSPRHLAQVRDPPREMSGSRALSRATKPSPADSVDQRDHGGFMRRNLRLGKRQSGIHDSPGANTNLHDPVISFTSSERVTAPGSTNIHADSRGDQVRLPTATEGPAPDFREG